MLGRHNRIELTLESCFNQRTAGELTNLIRFWQIVNKLTGLNFLWRLKRTTTPKNVCFFNHNLR